ncbi:MAG: hypothetical protein ACXACU_04455 [Candidatus Hodarchaeales archaeon]
MNFYNTSLSYSDVIKFLKIIKPYSGEFSFHPEKREVHYVNENLNFYFNLRIPVLFLSLNQNEIKLNKFPQICEEEPNYLVLLIRAGHSALGTVENDEITRHKVVTKYMVRKKQGKSQLTYLTTKGKARGGAKLRLAKSIEFFQEIRQKIYEWKEIIDKLDLIFYQSSPRLWNGLFKTKSKIPIAFSSTDARLRRIPITTYKPTFKEIRRVKYNLSKGNLGVKSNVKIASVEDTYSHLLSILDS